ncbi:hypothetical protein [Nocardia paucivorans]|uniref:hypothetical protein n=1 Tax=Nocardia paucivorans TaxID=114259 RepID=UPI0002FE0093|nr:hypothetical protein [Nocardia paucivorans]
MSYPYGGPGHPHPPGHPVPPGYPAPAGYGYPYVPRPPSGGTAITAGILAIIGGVVSLLIAVSGIIAAFDRRDSSLATGARRRGSSSSSHSDVDVDIDLSGIDGLSLFLGVVAALVALLLLIGGIMLLRRSGIGRIMVIVGCSVYLLMIVVGIARVGAFAGPLSVFFPVLTLVMASSGSTKRWIEAGRSPMPVAGGYGQPPYPTYG